MNNKIDLYLNRVCQISQLLLVGFAIFGYFYTVRPVYQNASLQESIAKKETELKSLQGKIDDLYINYRRELIRKFVMRVTFDCAPYTPLMMQPPSYEESEQKSFSIKLQESKELISENPYNCLRMKAENDTALRDLRNEDKQKLIATIESLKPSITEKYNEMVRQSEDETLLENLGKNNNSASFTARLEEFFIANGIKLPDDDNYNKQMNILAGLNHLISEFSLKFNATITDKVKI